MVRRRLAYPAMYSEVLMLFRSSSVGRAVSTTMTTSELRKGHHLCTITHATLFAVVALFATRPSSHSTPPFPAMFPS